MAKRMLIDATHPEETRVVVLDGNRLDEFDFESSTKKQIKGNIYLAKVTRVEPSLQAAFVDFGGNRHGFLAFSEIHPDYYRIPIGDRAPYREREYDDHQAPAHRGTSTDTGENAGETGEPNGAQGETALAEGELPDEQESGRVDDGGDPLRPFRSDQPTLPHDRPVEAPSSEQGGEAQRHSVPSGDAVVEATPIAAESPGPASVVEPPAAAIEPPGAAALPDRDLAPSSPPSLEASPAAGFGERALAERSSDDTLVAPHIEPSAGEEFGAPHNVAAESGQETAAEASFNEAHRSGEIPNGDAQNGDAPNGDIRNAEAQPGELLIGEAQPGDAERAAQAAADIQSLDTIGGDDFEEEARHRSRSLRHYKIQEVVKRRQIMLVQVTKEERGNKGAALTTYLSLAGRYCVLMPNTGRGGGVSRKITSVTDRRRLKEILEDLDLPEGMGVIVRTAGSERTKAEIKRDLEYLLRLWDEIRTLTLQSTAPALIYEEGNLIKRSIRDLYARDIDEVLVEGEEGYRTAKAFMKMLMPSHAKRVQPYRDPAIPLLQRFQVETQIDAIHSPVVQLRSGGYIVISPTEALVAIDVNSGRSTKERNIEETALRTNLEAADEVARQLRLRDLAGLIVVDFIDMEEHRNQNAVERRLKDAMRHDRARIQVGRISPFGLLEMSRQRLRPSLVEASTQPCPHCNGTGHIRSTESTALHVLRAIEEEGIRRRSAEICVYVPTAIALYVLNQKRDALTQIEQRYGFRVALSRDDTLIPPAFRLERLRALTPAEAAMVPAALSPAPPPIEDEDDEEIVEEAEESGQLPAGASVSAEEGGEDDRGRRRRRRRRRRRPGEEQEMGSESPAQTATPHGSPAMAEPGPGQGIDAEATETEEEDDGGETEAAGPEQAEHPTDGDQQAGRRRRRRGKRGGRRRARGDGPQGNGEEESRAANEARSAGTGEPIASTSVELIAPAMMGGTATAEAPFMAAPITSHDETIDTAEVPVAESGESLPHRSWREADIASGANATGEPSQHESEPAAHTEPSPAVTEPQADGAPLPVAETAPQGAALPAETEEHPAEATEAQPGPQPKLVTEKPSNPKRGWWTRLLQE
jgi:ribonuclease E